MSVNPARSTGPALFVGGWALQQLWLFWVAPLIGGIAAGFFYPLMSAERLMPAEQPGAERAPITERPSRIA
jgi:aquaporin Z